mgnify:CR=1 FL=1
MISQQIDFLDDHMPFSRGEGKRLARSLDQVRRGTYAEIASLKQCKADLHARLELLEKHICLGR